MYIVIDNYQPDMNPATFESFDDAKAEYMARVSEEDGPPVYLCEIINTSLICL